MQLISDEFREMLTGSSTPVVRVDAFREGRLIHESLPVTGGQVTITAGQSIRSTVTVSVTDGDSEDRPGGSLVPRAPGDVLHPLSGTELRVSAGFQLAQRVELVSLGRYMVIGAAGDPIKWSVYARPAGSPVAVMEPVTTTVECADYARKIQDDRFMAVEQPKAASVGAELARILRGVVPFALPDGVPSVPVPSDITYEADRLDAAQKLADVLDMDLILRPDGVATLQPRGIGAAVWDINAGDEGVLVSHSWNVTRDGFYNAVVVTGADSAAGLPIRATAVLSDGPHRFGGPAGRIPFYFNSPVITTQAAAAAAAGTRLNSLLRARTQEVTVECAWNPALEVGDTVRIIAPNGGRVAGRVVQASWPLLPGPMSLRVAVAPESLGQL